MKNGQKKSGATKQSLLYSCGAAGGALCYMLVSQMTFAMTEGFALTAISVSMIFMISRFFDGFTDFVAGNIIDRTHTRWGKARIYDLFMIFAWIALVACFCIPEKLSSMGKLIFLFIMYNLYTSVFNTFATCADTVRLKRSMEADVRVKAVSISGIVTTLASIIAGVMLPILLGIFGVQPNGWRTIAIIFAVPGIIFSVVRFLFLPENATAEEDAKEEKVGVLESVKYLFQNKYILLVTVVSLIRGLIVTATGNAGMYYFTYVFGDVSKAAIPSMFSVITVFAVAFMSRLVKKFGNVKTIIYSLIMGVAFYLLRYLMPTNLVWYTLCGIVAGACILPVSYLPPVMIIDSMEYGKWKDGKAAEGVYSSARSIADKIGLGVGSVVTGIILQMGALPDGGYSLGSIKFLNNGLPAVAWILCIVILLFYDLDKKLPQIKKELEERKQA